MDNMTFDKVVAFPSTLLVKVDKAYAYGEKEDEFKAFCKLAYSVRSFLVGEVPVQEYGDKEGDDMRERFGLKAEDFPAFLFFKDSKEPAAKFEGFADPTAKRPNDWDDDEDGPWEPPMRKDVTAENLSLWLRQFGIRIPTAGTIAELDDVVRRFLKNRLQDSDLQEAKKLAEGDYKDDKKALVYLRIMEKIKAKGEDYVAKELARVQKVLAGKITPDKQAELSTKAKILQVFALKDE